MTLHSPKTMRFPGVSIAVALMLLALAACDLGCGGGTQGIVIARVARAPITSGELADWMAALAPRHLVPDPPRYQSCISRARAEGQQPIGNAIKEQCEGEYAGLKQRALGFLIASDWLIAEAAAERLAPSGEEVEDRLKAERRANGAASPSARRLLVERELAAIKLAGALRASEPPVTRAQIAHYYAQHIRDFERREQRFFDIYEYFPSHAVAARFMSELASGRQLARTPYHESIRRARAGETWERKRDIYRAIFAARPNVYVGPVVMNRGYVIYRLRRIAPRFIEPLPRVEAAIATRLAQERHRRTFSSFLRAWRERWAAQTSCRAGYVISGCRQYTGVMEVEDLPGGLGLR